MPGYSTAEIDLADRARGGDLRALEELHRLYHQRLYHHALRMLQDPAAAQDVVQEAFTRAIAEIHRTRPSLRFKAWIYRITTNLCLRHLNRRRRWAPEEASAAEDERPTPEQHRQRTELAEQLTLALAELPPRYRQALLLREIDGLSYRELAEVLQLKESPLKVLLHRARLRLAALLITEQLHRDATVQARCTVLTGLVVRQASRRKMVRHIEGCASCRQRERRPAAELFALLPPIGALPEGANPFPGVQHTPAMINRIAWWLSSSWRWIAAGAGAVATTLMILAGINGSLPAPPPVARAAVAERAPQRDLPRGAGPRSHGSAAVPAQSAVHRESAPPVHQATGPLAIQGDLVQTEPRRPPGVELNRTELNPGPLALIPPLSPPRSALPYRPSSKAPAPGLPLSIKVLPPHQRLEIRRDRRFLPFTGDEQLVLGDVLTSLTSAPFAVRFPGGQWLSCRGRLKLSGVPPRGQGPALIQLELLEGELRAGATTRGKGIQITLGEGRISSSRSRVLAEQGEFRVHLTGKRAEVAALDAYLQVLGPHATRTLTPGSGLTVSGRVSFPRQLLPPAQGLRPIQGCAPRHPRISWSAVAGSIGYQVLLGADPHFLSEYRRRSTEAPWLQLGRLPPGKYFWMVQAVDRDKRPGQGSKIFSFKVGGTCP